MRSKVGSVIARNNSAFFALFLFCSLGLNVVLALKIRHMEILGRAQPRVNIVGVTIRSFAAREVSTHSGVIVQLDGRSKPTVLYVLNPACHWCARNMKNIAVLAHSQAAAYGFLGISLDSPTLEGYLRSNDIEFPVYSIDSYDRLSALKLGGTPETIVLSRDGKVLRDWPGAYTDNRLKEVQAYFHVTLPGLIPESSIAQVSQSASP